MQRYLPRAVAVIALAALAVVAPPWSTPASAHGGVNVTVHSDGSGSVWATVVWGDGHAAQERVTALLLATTATTRVGPVALQPVPGGIGTVAYAELLPPGHWHLAIDVALPAVGHCEADATIGPAAPPVQTTCAAPSAAASGPAAAPVGPAAPRGGLAVWSWIGVVAGIAGVAVAGLAWRQRTGHPSRPKR